MDTVKCSCIHCDKTVDVEMISYGGGHIAICPECGELAYNGE